MMVVFGPLRDRNPYAILGSALQLALHDRHCGDRGERLRELYVRLLENYTLLNTVNRLLVEALQAAKYVLRLLRGDRHHQHRARGVPRLLVEAAIEARVVIRIGQVDDLVVEHTRTTQRLVGDRHLEPDQRVGLAHRGNHRPELVAVGREQPHRGAVAIEQRYHLLHNSREELLGGQPLRDGVRDRHDRLRAPVGHAGLQLVEPCLLLPQRRLECVGERLLECVHPACIHRCEARELSELLILRSLLAPARLPLAVAQL
mmetsp:Transcript_65904/g.158956  ORF Transcript_65904/g.158956 Transcript_65904/m.158956 type:complete len:259 (+) Transcript_65904:175-951(+)